MIVTKKPNKTIFCLLNEDDGVFFSEGQIRSFNAIKNLILQNGASYFTDLNAVADFVNSCYMEK